jgi:hypothetical protein
LIFEKRIGKRGKWVELGGNTRTLAWLAQVEVAARKRRSHRMLEDIRLPKSFLTKTTSSE